MADGKSLAEKGGMTDSKIDVLQNYYGLAVRENLDDVSKMAKAIEASFYHVASTAEGSNSWGDTKKTKGDINIKMESQAAC